jgi:hypothetical protein
MRTRFAALAFALLLASAAAYCDEAIQPPWQGQPNTVTAAWDTWPDGSPDALLGIPSDSWSANPLLPTEPAPVANVLDPSSKTPDDYLGRDHVVFVAGDGELEFVLPNFDDANPFKEVWIQVTYRPTTAQMHGATVVLADGLAGSAEAVLKGTVVQPDGWVTEAWSVFVWPNPAGETVSLSFADALGGDPYPVAIDRVVVDTRCIVETFTLTVDSGTGGGAYPDGMLVEIAVAGPPPEAVFDSWVGDTDCLGNPFSTPADLVMPAHDVTVTATYLYPLIVNDGAGDGLYRPGESVDIWGEQYMPDSFFDVWTGDQAFVTDPYSEWTTVNMPPARTEVTATYRPLRMLNVVHGFGSGLYRPGEPVHIWADVPPGYLFSSWMGDEWCVADPHSPDTMVNMPDQDVYVEATFAPMMFNLDVVFGNGSGTYIVGEMVQIAAEERGPEWMFMGWSGDTMFLADPGSSVTDVIMPPQDVHVEAIFEMRMYQLDVIGGDGGGLYTVGQIVWVQAWMSGPGWMFVGWSGDSWVLDDPCSQYSSLSMPPQDVHLEAMWVPGPMEHMLTVSGGMGSGMYMEGTYVWMEADFPPEPGAMFDGWWGDSWVLDSPWSPSTGLTMPPQDIYLEARWMPPMEHMLTVIGGSGSGMYTEGTHVWIEAGYPPEPGWMFDGWMGDSWVLDDPWSLSTGLMMPPQDVYLEARWMPGPMEHMLTVSGGMGGGMYMEGTYVWIDAGPPPGEGWVFDGWGGDSWMLDNPSSPSTSLIMPPMDVWVEARWTYVPADLYELTVRSGQGSGEYEAGVRVTIYADAPPPGMFFDKWVGDWGLLDDRRASVAHFTMQAQAVWLKATYRWPSGVPGDLSGDGFVGQADLDIVLGSWGRTVALGNLADPSGDGFVGQADLDIVLGCWGSGSLP